MDNLDGIDLEADLDPAIFAWLSERGTSHPFERHEHLYHQGDPAKSVYLLQSGTVKSTCSDVFGHETLLKIHEPGSLLGLSALRPHAVRDASGMALTTCRTVSFQRNEFFELIRADGQLGVLLVQILLKRQQQLHARISEVTGHRVNQRLARVLLQLTAEMNSRVPLGERPGISISHEELATLVLSRRQYVTAILRSFVSDGLIRNARRQIVVTDPAGLRRIANGEQDTAH